jgi:hypothetical protein
MGKLSVLCMEMEGDGELPRINAEASCFNEGLLSDTEGLPSPQALFDQFQTEFDQ